MKRILITLAAVAMTLIAADAKEKTKTFEFGNITSIDASATFQIFVTQGNSDKVTVIYDDDIEQSINLDIDYSPAGKLSLSLKPFKYKNKRLIVLDNPSSIDNIRVYLEMDDISMVTLSGAAKISFTGDFTASTLFVGISGAASVKGLNIDGKKLNVSCSGASSLELAGDFDDEANIDLSGASKMTMKGNSADMDAEISGVGKLYWTGDFKECKISCTGSSYAELEGKTGNGEYECSGASVIEAKDFINKTAYVELSGASKAKINASKELRYNVSRACKMTYYGDAQLLNLNDDDNVVRGR